MGVTAHAAAALVLLSAVPARGEREALKEGVTIDWAAGLVEAPGSAAADLRAPSAEVARVKAERQARERAAARIEGALRALPRGRWEGDPPRAEELEKALAGAEAEVDYGTSGSVTLRLRLKLAQLPAPLLPAGSRRGKARPKAEARGGEP